MYKSPLQETWKKYGTYFWNDSCSLSELAYAIDYGAVGATSNPVIVNTVLEQDPELYNPIIRAIIRDYPNDSEDDLAWRVIEQVTVMASELLLPIYERSNGKQGRISIQVNPKNFNNTTRMVKQAIHFSKLAPNIQVKIPVTKKGIFAIEEATYHGVSINATVSFSVAQAIAVAQAVHRGLQRRLAQHESIDTMHPVCTIMVGRIGDWLKELVERDHLQIDSHAIDYAGVAVMKRAYRIFEERGYETSLLVAAYRNDNQWLEFVGGDLELTIPHKWIKRFNESNENIMSRIEIDVDVNVIAELYKIDDFKKVYSPQGMKPEDYLDLLPTRKTLNQFLDGFDNIVKKVRKMQLNLEE